MADQPTKPLKVSATTSLVIRNHLDDCDAWRQANAFAEVGAFCAAEEGQQMSPERVRRAAVRRYLADHRQVTAIRLQFIDLVTAKGVG